MASRASNRKRDSHRSQPNARSPNFARQLASDGALNIGGFLPHGSTPVFVETGRQPVSPSQRTQAKSRSISPKDSKTRRASAAKPEGMLAGSSSRRHTATPLRSSDGDWSIGVSRDSDSAQELDKAIRSLHTDYGRIPNCSTTTFLESRHTGVLYPWLERLRQKCQDWSTSCVGRVKKAWTPKGEQETRRKSLRIGPSKCKSKQKYAYGAGDLDDVVASLSLKQEKKRIDPHRRSLPVACSDPGFKFVPNPPPTSRPCNKTIYFIRHGTAFCNTLRFGYWRVDQRLTPQGWSQINSLRLHLQKIQRPQVVIVSTLSRALETASGAFGTSLRPGEAYTQNWSKDGRPAVLMNRQEAVANVQSGHPGIVKSPATPPLIGTEECRERFGDGVVPNKRRPLSDAKKHFQGVDFSSVESDCDELYAMYDRPGGETCWEVCQRGKRFLEYLRTRPEDCIAVISHGHFLNFMLNRPPQPWQDFWNGELRAYQLSNTSCTPTKRDLWFRPSVSNVS